MTIETLLTSTVIAAIVSAIISWWIAERRIKIENITKERAKWREQIRAKSDKVHKAIVKEDKEELTRLRSAFRLLLNPHHKEDQSIIDSININQGNPKKQAKEFSKRISLLLKHDWERAKRETKPVFFKGSKPQRVKYEQYNKNS